MPLLKIFEFLKPSKNLERTHKGVVISTTDALKIGAIKATVEGLFVDSEANLPFIYPMNPFFTGGKNDKDWFSVPEIGSEIAVVFPFDDIYLPFYIGYWRTSGNKSTIFDEDYPDMYGFLDSTGTYFKINKKKLYIEILHNSGAHIKIDNRGNIGIEHPGNMTIDTQGNLSWKVGGTTLLDTTGDTTIKAGGNITLEAGGNIAEKAGGNATIDAGGTIAQTAGGVHSSKGSSVAHG